MDAAHLKMISYRGVPKENRQIEGINVVDPVELICTFLRYRKPLDAMTSVDSICVALCRADARARGQTEQRFKHLKKQVLTRLDELHGCHGLKRARQLIELMTPWAHSPLETRFRLLCAAYGFPRPVLQQRMDTGRGLFFLDAYFPQQRLGVELDGLMKYRSASVLREEKLRDVAIEREGLRILHYVFAQLRRPELVAREIAEWVAPSRPLVVICPEFLEGW
ncbi:hypothetical protein BM477_00655 [Boudabousia marimammalium]|uniref:DUF559 domain-containing protein n=1 Tax=Boudabousia marimammalium TaxID=156892 RepID=A0A1Q5PSH6_9ACTO|nr:hypothetical protein BM477_00655 [Boudabousia marimammalium]